MKRYGIIRFNWRMVAFVCMLVVACSFLMPAQVVRADDNTYSYTLGYTKKYDGVFGTSDKSTISIGSPLVFFINKLTDSGGNAVYTVSAMCKGDYSNVLDSLPGFSAYFDSSTGFTCVTGQSVHSYDLPNENISSWYDLKSTTYNTKDGKVFIPKNVVNYGFDNLPSMWDSLTDSWYERDSFQPNDKAYSEIGALDNVQMETYITNKKDLIDADENADLSKINQDKVIVYSSSSTTGIDLSKGGYKVQLYGSYAWQDKSGNIKSEDKGHKTFIKDWKAENNIKGLNRSNYTWIDWKSANDKVEADKSDNAHKPNVFEKMTTYANYQYEPIWYLRIVSKDNKYGAWVKLYNSSSKKGKYTSKTVDDNDNSVSDSDGGYSKPKDTSEITGTGDTPQDAKDNVQKSEEKQDNKDISDSTSGNNSTFDKLEEFTKGIGDVPKMIADIFSFLPSWCLEVVGIGFALLMVLIVVKFIRG